MSAAVISTLTGQSAELLVNYEYKPWFYGDSIGFEGFVAASDLLGDSRYLGFAHGMLRAWVAADRPFCEWDNTVPGHALCQIIERTGDDLLIVSALRLSEYLRTRRKIAGVYVSLESAALRRPYGGARLVPSDAKLLVNPGAAVYIDCLHFDPPFFAHLGRILDDDELITEGVDQALAYVELLMDEPTGLLNHFHLEGTGRSYVTGWSRGQGWALLGLLDVAAQLNEQHPRRPEVAGAARALATTLVEAGAGGTWTAIVGEPQSGPESSASAFYAAAFWRGIELGVLDDIPFAGAAESALAAALRACDANGVLRGVSAVVWSSTMSEHYHFVPLGHVVPWGQGPLVLALEAYAKRQDPAREVGLG